MMRVKALMTADDESRSFMFTDDDLESLIVTDDGLETLMVTGDARRAQTIEVIDRICQELNQSFAVIFDQWRNPFLPLSHLSRVKHVHYDLCEWPPHCWHRDVLPENLRGLSIQNIEPLFIYRFTCLRSG